MFDVSFIIVSWNAKKYLSDCLQSIYDTIHNIKFEVIVVDNNSSDGSPEMVKKYFPQVNLICAGSNLGFAKGNNIGIKHGRGHYFCFVNSDVVILDNCIDDLAAFMDQHPRIGIAGPRMVYPDLTFQPSCKRIPTLFILSGQILGLDRIFPRFSLHLSYEEQKNIRDVEVLVGCFWMVRREAFNQVGGLDEKFFMYGEDVDWCKRFGMAGWRVVHFPSSNAIHFCRVSSSREPVRFYIERQKSSLYFWKKYHSKPSMLCYVAVIFLKEFLRLGLWTTAYMIRPSRREKAATMIERYRSSIKLLFKVKNYRN